MTPTIHAVLFDMGGVLVELSPLDRQLGVQGMTSEQFWDRWLTSPSVRALEHGTSDVTEFAKGLIEEFALAIEPAEVLDRFAAVPSGLYPGAVELAGSLTGRLVTGLLSNTNQVHWEQQPDAAIIKAMFDRNYVSYQLGLMKPDREIFDHVVADLDTAADQVLFLDDNLINVEGARAAGLHSEMVKGPDGAAAALDRYGLLAG